MIAVFAVNLFIIGLVVLMHYEFLHRITLLMPILKIRHRFRIVLGVCIALVAHAAEIWVFAVAFYIMNQSPGWGQLAGNFNGSLMDCAYFSFTTFATLGFGDIEPHGDLRFLVGLEALTGFVLITWTASFLFIEMTRYWDEY